MSFCTYSKEFTANLYTSVENAFLTKYLPIADGDAVRVYLYGLYLCQCAQEFDAVNTAKLLKMTPEKLVDIFRFWEEFDLVRILSRDPLYVEYLPVSSSVGKPKPIRAEKYAEFNRGLYRLLQRAQKQFQPYELIRIVEFLENNPMEPQALLLIAEYCVNKDGKQVTCNHILNKAKLFVKDHKLTYEQVENELRDFNLNYKKLEKIFQCLNISRKPTENDYEYLNKWLANGMKLNAVYACAERLQNGTLATLDRLIDELCEKNVYTEENTREYLKNREKITDVVFAVARRLGVKVQNPRAFADEYVEKWLERGYDAESLSLLASLCMKLGYGFPEMDALLGTLYAEGLIDEEGINAYCAGKNKELRLLQKIQSTCGVMKKSQSTLDMLNTWKSWNFSDEMILEAARRSANASAPLPYMNKLLSEWKREGCFTPAALENRQPSPTPRTQKNDYRTEAAIAADERSERERHYAELRQRAEQRAEKARAEAEKNADFTKAESEIKKGEIELARAEIYSPEKLPALERQLAEARRARAEALAKLRLTEKELSPQYRCARCADTGFLPNGKMCDCYKK